MPNIFDEATALTEQMFDSEPVADETMVAEESTAETVDETPSPEEPPTQPTEEQAQTIEAVNTAEEAANIAAQKDADLQRALAQVQALQQRQTSLEQTIADLSKANEQAVVEEMTTPPELDLEALTFADADTIANAKNKYTEDVLAYSRKMMMKELEPFLNYAKEGIAEKQKQTALKDLSAFPEMSGLEAAMPQIESIIKNNKWLDNDNMPMEEKILNAYALAMGVNAINTPPAEPPKDPTPEELLEIYNNNPAFQDLVEKQRINVLKNSQQVPPLSASSGAANVALEIPEKPKTLEEASKRTKEMFGFR